jgi:cellulose synthase/poly-beta-1,6-N-acetylglucosamine synthase-like glycosyltransferase
MWMVLKVFLPDFINSWFITTDPDSEEQLLCNENMNLAEDRILCFGIHKNGFDLAYLPDAYSEVDPIKNLHQMFGQRKRWINGSYFAFAKVKEELSEFKADNQICEIFLKVQMFYLSMVNAVSYFSVSLFLFTVHIAMRAFYSDVLSSVFEKTLLTDKVIPFFINTMDYIYVFFVLSLIYCSLNLTYNNKRFKQLIYIGTTVMGIFSIIVTIVLIHDLVKSGIDGSVTCTTMPT